MCSKAFVLPLPLEFPEDRLARGSFEGPQMRPLVRSPDPAILPKASPSSPHRISVILLRLSLRGIAVFGPFRGSRRCSRRFFPSAFFSLDRDFRAVDLDASRRYFPSKAAGSLMLVSHPFFHREEVLAILFLEQTPPQGPSPPSIDPVPGSVSLLVSHVFGPLFRVAS